MVTITATKPTAPMDIVAEAVSVLAVAEAVAEATAVVVSITLMTVEVEVVAISAVAREDGGLQIMITEVGPDIMAWGDRQTVIVYCR